MIPLKIRFFVPVTTEARCLISEESRPEILNLYPTTTEQIIAKTSESTPFFILVAIFSNQLVQLPKYMHIAIASRALDTTYESNLPTLDDEVANRSTRIRFSPDTTVIYRCDTVATERINESKSDSVSQPNSYQFSAYRPNQISKPSQNYRPMR